MSRLLSAAMIAGLFATTGFAFPPKKPRVVKGPIVGKPVRPSVSPPLREILRRQREGKRKANANASPQRKVLNAYLSKFRAARRAAVIPVETEELADLFPKTSFFVLRFRKYPVAIAPPKPLASNNIFAVTGKKVTHLADAKALGRHFQKNLKKIEKQSTAKSAAVAFLRLSHEFHQDGYFKFQKPTVKVTSGKGGPIARGEAKVVMQRGNRGSVTVSLSFLQGKLENVTPGGKVFPGIRPRCQATRLRHPDPVIRAIMRRDLIVLGSAARIYLAEQWQNAGPKLRKEIEGVWKQILAEGR
ncbi:MAG: hypothetical protein ACE5KM_20945 [Planctomycetaceae bacterium]